jgi:hypothetical protein
METTHAPHLAAATDHVASFPTARVRARVDGWTPEKQRLFCETLADCGLVREAAAAVGLSPQSAYALRRHSAGRAFAMAWNAALYLARHRLMDLAIERAMEGNVDTVTKDGAVVGERKHQDMRHLLAAITKLEGTAFADQATRSVAGEFDLFLDAMEADADRGTALPADLEAPSATADPDVRTSRSARFFKERQGRGPYQRIGLDHAADQMHRAVGEPPAFRQVSMVDMITQQDIDDFDAFDSFEVRLRAAAEAQRAEAQAGETGQTALTQTPQTV